MAVPTTGFLKLYRKFFLSEFWTEEREFSRAEAWLDLLNIVEFVRSSKFIRGKRIDVEVGEVIASGRYLAERWQWSHKKVRNFLAALEQAHQITQRRAQGENIITLTKYASYNSMIPEEGTPKGTPKGTEGAHRGHKYIEKEENKENNGHASAPTIFSFLPVEFSNSEKFREVWENWLCYRRERKLAKWTESTLKRQSKQFEAWGLEESIANVEASITNGWQGIFPEKKGTSPTAKDELSLEAFRIGYRWLKQDALELDICAERPYILNVLKADMETLKTKYKADYDDIVSRYNQPYSKIKTVILNKLRK